MASFQAASVDISTTQSTVPKKRRRRAPATGATEDCFTCRKRQVQCDRKRPYCTQCVGLGKECSGYKTILTWGVGVASRGKLRGLSLPVPNPSSKPARVTKRTSSASETKVPACVTSDSVLSGTRPTASGINIKSEVVTSPPLAASCPGNSVPQDYICFSAASPTAAQYSATPPLTWDVPAFNNDVDNYNATTSEKARKRSCPRPLHKTYTSQTTPNDESVLSASTTSWTVYSDSGFPSPAGFSHTPDEVPFSESLIGSFPTPCPRQQTSTSSADSFQFSDAPRSCPPTADCLSSSFTSDQSNLNFAQPTSSQHGGLSYASVPPVFYSNPLLSEVDITQDYGHGCGSQASHLLMDTTTHEDEAIMACATPLQVTAIPRSISPFGSYQLPSRMHFLLDYYSQAICPVLVAFDGPMNPYRMHVLRLAMKNEGLQNAIAALAINNMRMRDYRGTRRLTIDANFCNTAASNSSMQLYMGNSAGVDSALKPEETRYKAVAVQLLNSALSNPARARDDSVLAMLLILCLFHVCDSGFTKFKAQLAGVQKLLSMRDKSVQSDFIGWIEMFFTWFDVMASTVNDRELQIRGDSLDMLDLSANLGALEHLAGCDGRLFKLIARLGRLNLLSQNRPVRQPGVHPAPRPSPRPKLVKDYYSLQYDRPDGNGWCTPMSSSSEESNGEVEDPRQEFWNEWHTIRERLQSWQNENPSPSGNALPSQNSAMHDLQHISEAFRYSALLYIERLAYPSLPPGTPNFQHLVSQALYHIGRIGVTSCVNKFLLWPLFIAGTECTDEPHREIVRRRCVEIQKESGFFNNLSGLEVLERVWREDDGGRIAAAGPRVGCGRQAFRWRKAMDRVDGEYIVI